MPLGVREVLLVVRAQNMGSGVLRGLAGDFNNLNGAAKRAAQQQMATGQSLMAVGTAIGAVGAAGLVFLGKATSMAVDYNRQVALTKTQMYGVKASFDQVSQAGLDVARKIAVPLDQIQGGLYDIFSSMDVNLKQAQYLLTNFSKEAVAGQVDLSTAERATIGVLNSYHMKVQDVNKVQDIMFNLVKYGVGTYGDFANTIGRVTPSAVRANQTFEQTAAIMAFLTRNGMSASNAASSAGRALDAIGKSRDKMSALGKTVEDALGDKVAHKLGFFDSTMVKLTDHAGRLLPVNQIMTELGTRLKGLNPTQLNDVLTTMFKGTGGTIQAMRFFNVAIHNFDQLNHLTKDMYHNRGALQAAYNIMANTPAAKIQLLKNTFKSFMIVLGNQLLPIVGNVAKAFAGLFSWLGKLPPSTMKIIAIVIAVSSVLAVLAGIVLTVVGAWMVFSAVIAASEIALLPILATIGIVIAAIAALAVAAYLIYKNWNPISKWFHDMWFDMWHWIDRIWQNIVGTITRAWQSIERVFNQIMTFITGSFDQWWKTHGDAIKEIWQQVWGGITDITSTGWDVVSGIFKVGMAYLTFAWRTGLAGLELIAKVTWAIISAVFRIAWAQIENGFKIFWAVLVAVAKIAWAGIISVVKIAWDVIVGLFSIFIDILTGHWHTALVDLQNMARQIWNAIKGFLISVWNAIKGAAGPIWNAMKAEVVGVWHAIYDSTQSIWNNIRHYLSTVWGSMQSGASSAVSGLQRIWNGIENIFKIPVNWVIRYVYDDGIKALWNGVMNAIGLSKFDLPNIKTFATGGKIPGFGGGDRHLILAEAGEAIVDKNRTRKHADLLGWMGVPGFAAGGQIPNGRAFAAAGPAATISGPGLGPLSGVLHVGGAVAKMTLAAATGNQTAFANALTSALPHGGGASGHLASMIATLPVAMAKKAISGVWKAITGAGSGSNINYKPGGGVGQWRGLVVRALAMEGLNPGFVLDVLYQMQTESGGNPRAINLWDSNAAMGDPSRGLMQTIMSTFLAYHWPGTSMNIYDPLANIAAAINYSAHGRGFGTGPGQMGSGHGYARGTGGARSGWAWVGENGPELVNFNGGEVVVPHGGYAKGTKRRIPQSEINSGLSIFAAYVQGGLLSLAKMAGEQTTFLRTIARYYSGSALHSRQATIQRQTKAMENASKQLTSLQNTAKAASTYANQVTTNLSSYAALSGMVPGAGTATAQSNSILTNVQGKLANLRRFASILTRLRKAGVSVGVIQQIVDMGPDDGYTFANALLSGPLVNLQMLNTYEKQIGTVTGQVGKAAAAAVYGQAAVDGFKAREKQLTAIMKQLGKELGVEAARWLHVPANKLPKGYASGTNWASPGVAWVGENGPELVQFRGGERVTPMGRGGQTIVIYTNEIDPRRHAAELGWELARRSG
jgi:TP901 family phage tail tape measure protein